MEQIKKIKVNDMPKQLKILAVVAFVLVLPFGFLFHGVDPDLFFILPLGKDIIQNGIPTTDMLSMHEGLDFMAQQWLSDVIYYEAYSLLGFIGTKLVVCICVLYASILVYKLCLKVSGNQFVSICIDAVSVIMMISFAFATRPKSFTVCILLTELYLLEEYMQKQSVKYLVPIPLLSVLLINLHASMWLLIFIMMLPFIVDSFNFDVKFIKCQGGKKLPLFITMIVSAVAGFVNPYGLEAMTYLFRSYGVSSISNNIAEMQAVDVNELIGLILFVSVIVALLINFRYDKEKGVLASKVRYILLVAGFGFMTFSSYRNSMFFVCCTPFTIAYCLKDFNPSVKFDGKANPVLRVVLIIFIVIGLVVTGLFVHGDLDPVLNALYGEGYEDFDDEYEVFKSEGTVDYILQNYEDAQDYNIYVGYNDGAYLEFMGLKPYIDARAEVFLEANNHKEDIYDEYMNVKLGLIDYEEFLDKYNFDLIMASKSDAISYYLPNDSEYKLVYSDDYFDLYERVVSQ